MAEIAHEEKKRSYNVEDQPNWRRIIHPEPGDEMMDLAYHGYLWPYADRTAQKRPVVTYDLRPSDGPENTCTEYFSDCTIEPEWLRISYHGSGSKALREIVAESYGIPSPDQIALVAGGASQANHHVITSMLTPKDIAYVEWPSYDPLQLSARNTHCQVKLLNRPKGNGFQINKDEWAAALADHPRLIVISNLHNPSNVASRNIPELLEMVDAHNANLPSRQQTYVLVDEAYREASDPLLPMSALLSPYAISTFGLSKAYGLSGMRVGFIIGGSPGGEPVRRVVAYGSMCSAANSAVLEGIVGKFFFPRRLEVLQTIRDRRTRRLNTVLSLFAQEGVQLVCEPSGGNAVLVQLPDPFKDDDIEFCLQMQKEVDGMATPGSYFGLPGTIRVGYMFQIDEDHLLECLRRLCSFYKKFL